MGRAAPAGGRLRPGAGGSRRSSSPATLPPAHARAWARREPVAGAAKGPGRSVLGRPGLSAVTEIAPHRLLAGAKKGTTTGLVPAARRGSTSIERERPGQEKREPTNQKKFIPKKVFFQMAPPPEKKNPGGGAFLGGPPFFCPPPSGLIGRRGAELAQHWPPPV